MNDFDLNPASLLSILKPDKRRASRTACSYRFERLAYVCTGQVLVAILNELSIVHSRQRCNI